MTRRPGERETTAATEAGGDPILSVRNLHKRYGSGDRAVEAVEGVSFDVASGSITGLLGHNGAGKTTVIKMIIGVVTPTAGTIRIHGVDARRNPGVVAESTAAVLEGARNVYWRLTVRENLNFFARIAGLSPAERADRHDRLLDQLDLLDRADTVVNKLSRGMKQKVSLAALLAREPDLLILDEPTMGLDVESSLALRREIGRIVDDEDMTVIISSHDMDVIEDLCDQVVILDEGAIAVDDSLEALREVFRSQSLELTIHGTVSESFRSELEADFAVESWRVNAGHTQLRVRIDRIEEIQVVLSHVFDADLRLLDVQTTQIDMKDIYLEAVGNGDDEIDGREDRETYA